MWTFLTALIEWLHTQVLITGDRKEAAIKALQTAALQTNVYDASLSRGEARNPAREIELVSLWSSAASGFYRLDPQLAERLQLKAEYWTDPESWTPEQVHSAHISLQQITHLTRQLLHEG
jgi:hypothetical protein